MLSYDGNMIDWTFWGKRIAIVMPASTKNFFVVNKDIIYSMAALQVLREPDQ